MSTYEPDTTLEDFDDLTSTVDRLVEFYRHNGYNVDERRGPRLRLVRGRPHAGWWASKMTRLKTVVTIEPTDLGLDIRYRITTTGQFLADDDRQFWNDEISAATTYAKKEDELCDLRSNETERARRVKSEIRQTGVYAAFVVFLLVATFGVVAHLTGWL